MCKVFLGRDNILINITGKEFEIKNVSKKGAIIPKDSFLQVSSDGSRHPFGGRLLLGPNEEVKILIESYEDSYFIFVYNEKNFVFVISE